MVTRKTALWAATALTTGAMMTSDAWAQSTGSQEFETIVVAASRQAPSIEGIMTAEQAPKARSTVTQDYIATQQAGQTILETLNLTPGLNFVNNDPYGGSGGNIRLRGFDNNRISLMQDGIPLNDTGNYAIYSNQQLDPELIEQATVNIGTTDVDSPTASATGGTINYVTRKPAEEFGVVVQPSYGSFDYMRIFGLVDTGTFGPWNTSAWFSASYTDYDKFKGPGDLTKHQYNARIYQPIGDNGDFISVIGHYNRNRNNFYRNLTQAEFRLNREIDRVDVCARPTPGAGTVQNEGAGIFAACGNTTTGVDSGYYNLFINPSDTANIRAQGRFTLADGLTLTVDPSYQYVLANGGGNEVVAETDQRLQGSRFNATRPTANGVDLNGDGDILDRIRLYRPNNTNTNRFGVTSSLIWNVNDDNSLRLSYTYDRGRHRQTGEFGFLDAEGNPENVFGGREGQPVLTADGTPFQNRDRLSYAILNQVAGEYRGDFLDGMVTVNLGVRAPFFKRELNQYCYTMPNSFAYCSAQTASTVPGNYLRPFEATKKYDDVLPNVGVSFRPFEGHQIFVSYAEGLSAPRTDDLYDVQIPNTEPETTKAFDVGYRFQSGSLLASIGGYYTKFNNRIVRSFDQDRGINISRNVGDVDFKGFDGQIGFEPVKGVALYATASYTDTEVKDDLRLNATTVLPTKGRQLVETPKWQWGARAEYSGAAFVAGLEITHVGKRFSTDVNDEFAPGYNVVDLNLRYNLDSWGFEGSYIQLNANNLFDEKYLGNIFSTTNAVTIPGSNGFAPTYSVGSPQSFSVTLRTAF